MVKLVRDNASLTDEQLSNLGDLRDDASRLDVIALTMVSGFAGIGASGLGNNWNSLLLIASTIFILFMFHVLLQSFVDLVFYEQWRRAIFLGVVSFSWAGMAGFFIGEITEKIYVGLGLTYGWWITFMLYLIGGHARTASKLVKQND